MKYRDFLKERGFMAAIFGWLLFSIEIFLLVFPGSEWLMIYFAISMVSGYFLVTGLEYRRIHSYLKKVYDIAENLDEPYLVSEMILPAITGEEKLWQDFLHMLGKSMKEHVNEYRRETKEYKEYIELWIHEVKIPIASVKLMIENNRSSIPSGMENEIIRIEQYTEQALYYARSNDVEKDYFVRPVKMQKLVNDALALHKLELIQADAKIDLHDLDFSIHTDGKWMVFILGQLIGNSIKYCREYPRLEIYGVAGDEKSILCFKDDGIGISEEEVSRVFDKGFTGSNGRTGKRSTGIGLYLCKKLCVRLGLEILLESHENRGCLVKIVFPKASFISEVIE